MPWKASHVVEERFRWLFEFEQSEASLAELCRKYGVSRKTAYKWLGRYRSLGAEGLLDRASTPLHSPARVAGEIEAAVVELRRGHPTWGPKKLLAWLERWAPERVWPAGSTVAAILARHGLSGRRRRRQRTPLGSSPLVEAAAPNDVWAIDFKGWFRTGDGRRCDPLTVTDSFSRYLLCCTIMERTDSRRTRRELVRLFRSQGLPDRIRSDNGPPFSARGGLSELSVWWLRLGILPERIEPGEPQQNGRHERMHRTLKQETQRPAAATLAAQQRRFERFVEEYNYQRPHEALGQTTPAEHYCSSKRSYPESLPEMEYPARMEVRVADQGGKIRWKQARCKLGRPLAGQLIGVETVGEGMNHLWFGRQLLGALDERRARSGARKKLDGYWPPLQSPNGLLTRRPVAVEEGDEVG